MYAHKNTPKKKSEQIKKRTTRGSQIPLVGKNQSFSLGASSWRLITPGGGVGSLLRGRAPGPGVLPLSSPSCVCIHLVKEALALIWALKPHKDPLVV